MTPPLKGAVNIPTIGPKSFYLKHWTLQTLMSTGMKRPSIKLVTTHLLRLQRGEKIFSIHPYTSVCFKISIFIWLGIYTIQ